MCSGDKKSQLQLSWRELLLLLQTRCSYSCFCSKALSRHMKVVVDISRATQVQGAGLPFQQSHVQDYRTTYHSMLTTPSRQIRKTHSLTVTSYAGSCFPLLPTARAEALASRQQSASSASPRLPWMDSTCRFDKVQKGGNKDDTFQPATRVMATTSLLSPTRTSLVASWSSHQRACRMSENVSIRNIFIGLYVEASFPIFSSLRARMGQLECITI